MLLNILPRVKKLIHHSDVYQCDEKYFQRYLDCSRSPGNDLEFVGTYASPLSNVGFAVTVICLAHVWHLIGQKYKVNSPISCRPCCAYTLLRPACVLQYFLPFLRVLDARTQ